jgi:hypothetical protein
MPPATFIATLATKSSSTSIVVRHTIVAAVVVPSTSVASATALWMATMTTSLTS